LKPAKASTAMAEAPANGMLRKKRTSSRGSFWRSSYRTRPTKAQAEAVTTLLLGRPLGLNNTYAFDSRTVLSLLHATLTARRAVREGATPDGQQRIDDADPFILRWYAPTPDQTNFASCCAGVRLALYTVGVGHEAKALPLVRRTEITGRQTVRPRVGALPIQDDAA